MDESLFHEFPEVSPKQWKLKIQYDLKGAEYTTLLHKTPEGIDIKPFYTKEDYPEKHSFNAFKMAYYPTCVCSKGKRC